MARGGRWSGPVRWPVAALLLALMAVLVLARPASPTREGESTWSPSDLMTPGGGVAPTKMLAASTANDPVPADSGGQAAEIAKLRNELAMTRAELDRWRSGQAQGRGGTTFDVPPGYRFLAADVQGGDLSARRLGYRLNRGSVHGVKPGLPVLDDNGLVGVVRRVWPRSCLVQAVVDAEMSVAVEQAPDGPRAIARGQGADEPLRLEAMEPGSRWVPGAAIVTSGQSRSLYPRGLPIGFVLAQAGQTDGTGDAFVEPTTEDIPDMVLILMAW